jgi:hypothetical protein
MSSIYFRMIIILLFTHQAKAADIGLSVRALGMGNAYTAIVNDSDSIFYNPAGLAKTKGFSMTLLDPAIGMNNLESYQDFVDIFQNANDVSSLMNDLYGKEVSFYAGAKSLVNIGGFAFGGYGVADVNLAVNNPVYPNIDAKFQLDYAFVGGWGFEAIPDMLHVGVLTRRVVRRGGEIPVGVSTIATLDGDALQEALNRNGIGYALDFGASFTLPMEFNPTISYTWRDVGDTRFLATGGNGAPQPVKSEQIIGLGMSFESLLMSIRPALDFRFVNHSGMQLGQRVNFGVELSFPLIDVRAGFHQGYYTLGAGFDFWLMRLDAATYGVELGNYPGQLEDRRYMLQMTFEFGVDPSNFSFFKMERPSVRQHGRKLRR